MKVVTIENVIDHGKAVDCPKGGFTSYRFLTAADGMGFGVHKTVIPRGEKQFWHYKHHLEACYCISGKGLLTHVDSGCSWEITPDVLYALDKNDRHTFQAFEDTVLISIFNPPIVGHEVHDASGSYCLPSDGAK